MERLQKNAKKRIFRFLSETGKTGKSDSSETKTGPTIVENSKLTSRIFYFVLLAPVVASTSSGNMFASLCSELLLNIEEKLESVASFLSGLINFARDSADQPLRNETRTRISVFPTSRQRKLCGNRKKLGRKT